MKKTALVREPDTLKIRMSPFSGGPIVSPEVEELRDEEEKLPDRDQVGSCNFCST